MDWPLTAAVGGLAAVVGVVGFGAVAMMRSEAPKPRVPGAMLTTMLPAPQPTPLFAAPTPALPSGPALAAFEQSPAPIYVPRVTPQQPRLELPQVNSQLPPKARKPAIIQAPTTNTASLHSPDRPAQHIQPPREPHIKGVMTSSEISRIRASLRLTGEQVPLWRPVEAVLRDIGRQQMTQIKNGGTPEVDSGSMQRVYYAARPLLGTLQEDQKEQVRRLARSMGYASVASML
jgi:hypothetical protein